LDVRFRVGGGKFKDDIFQWPVISAGEAIAFGRGWCGYSVGLMEARMGR